MNDDHNWNIGNHSLNFTDDNFQYCEIFLGEIVPWSLAVYLSFLVTAAIANILLLLAIYKDPLKCFRKPTTYFIVNLSISDLLNSLFHLEELLISQTMYGSTVCLPGVLGTINSTFGMFIFYLAFPSVTVLALERYMSVAHSLWHQVNVTARVCYICIVAVWLLNCACIAIIVYVSYDNGLAIAYPSLFLSTTVIVYLMAFYSIRKQNLTLVTDNSKSQSVKRMMKLRLKNQNSFLTTVLIINIFLVLGFTPTIIGTTLKYMSEHNYSVLFYITDILFLINLASNPFLYIWRLPKYRKTLRVMYCKR